MFLYLRSPNFTQKRLVFMLDSQNFNFYFRHIFYDLNYSISSYFLLFYCSILSTANFFSIVDISSFLNLASLTLLYFISPSKQLSCEFSFPFSPNPAQLVTFPPSLLCFIYFLLRYFLRKTSLVDLNLLAASLLEVLTLLSLTSVSLRWLDFLCALLGTQAHRSRLTNSSRSPWQHLLNSTNLVGIAFSDILGNYFLFQRCGQQPVISFSLPWVSILGSFIRN